MKTIDIQYAKEIYDYNPITGQFTRKTSEGRGKKGSIAGHLKKNGYVQIYLNYERVSGHRLAWAMYYNEQPPKLIDHINRIPSDNRIENLRDATFQQNLANQTKRKNNKSGYKGVSFDKGKWVAQIGINRKVISIGRFNCPKEASEAYSKYSKKIYGDYACIL